MISIPGQQVFFKHDGKKLFGTINMKTYRRVGGFLLLTRWEGRV